MPFEIEHEGKTITVWTQEEHDQDVAGLKVTNENLKTEKAELTGKLTDAKEQARQLEEAKAKAEGDNETLQRLADEREAEKQREIEAERKRANDLVATIKQEKESGAVQALVSKLGAGGPKNEDLQDLIKSRFKLDFDVQSGEISVSGDGVKSIEELEKLISESERYAAYRPASGASGGGTSGSNGSGAAASKNPFAKGEHFNLTEQARILSEDPAMAAQLKAQAGN